jgi:predicted AAA+ superfamily ATPase
MTNKTFKRLLKLPLNGSSSIFLFGPRGTGKTAWLKSNLPNSIYIDLLDFNNYNQFSANPQRLENLIPVNYDGWVVIDEIQRIPELLNEVHRLIEAKKIRFVLTGSSARSLRKLGTNLLAGRALTYYMHPLIIQEIGELFDFNHALNFGLLPSAVTHPDPQKYLESYVQTYVREEVLQEGLTRNIGSFSRFLEAASFSQGNVLNVSEIARELGLNRLLVSNYFSILDDLLLGKQILPFTYRAKRNMIAHGKFYFFDTGVFRIIRPKGLLDSPQEIDGSALETLFLQSLQAVNDYFNLSYKIYFWRTQSGNEVDFVLYGPKGLYAFEIKRSAKINSSSLKGLKSFLQDYPQAQAYIVYLGKNKEYHDNITALPFVETLKILPDILAGTN